MKKIYYVLLAFMMCTFLAVQPTDAAIDLPSIGKIGNYNKGAHFSPDHRTILTTLGSNVQVSSANTGSLISNIPTNLNQVAATFSQDGSKIFVVGHKTGADYGVTADEYDTKSGQFLRKAFTVKQTHSGYSLTHFLLNKQETISYVLINTELFFIDLTTGTVIDKVTYQQAPKTIVYNAKNNQLVVVLANQLNILDADTAEFMHSWSIELGYNAITSAVFDQQGSTLYVAAGSKALMAFDATAKYKLIPFIKNEFSGSAATTNKTISISPNNKYLVLSGNENYRTSIYQLPTGKLVTTLNTTSTVIAFSQDNKKLLMGTGIYDATDLEEKEIERLVIQGNFIVSLGQVVSFEAYGLTQDNEKVTIDPDEVKWTIANESILAPYYGKFSGESSGMTTITASYNGVVSTVSIVVAAPFKDIPSAHPNYEAIHYMREIGIINGYGEDNTYRPNNPIPRHHVAAMVGRSGIDLPAIRAGKNFADIPLTHANYANIQKLYRAGILDGSGNNFNPINNITHIQLAKILTNIFHFEKSGSRAYTFSDVATSHWGHSYAEIMVSNGIMPVSNGNFNTNSPVTRSQFAQYFYNALMIAK